MASLHCSNNTAILLVSSSCGTWVLLWRNLGQKECVGPHASWGAGEHVALPSQPSGFSGSPMPCNCFFWSLWTGQGMIDVWLSITQCWTAMFQPSTETRQKDTWGRRGCKEIKHEMGRNSDMRDGSKRVLIAILIRQCAERHYLKWHVSREAEDHTGFLD